MTIRRYLLLILLSLITLVTFVAAIQGYRTSMERTSELFDSELTTLAQTVLDIYGQPSVQQASTALIITQVSTNDAIAFQLWQLNKLMLKSSNAPNNVISPFVENTFTEGFNETNFSGRRWRTLVLKSAINDDETHHSMLKHPQWIIVAQPLEKRFQLAEQVILSAVAPIVMTMPILALFIWLAIYHALKPLTQLTKELTSKKANDLSLISADNQVGELVPVVQTLNHLFERLSEAFERERRFASDAAHELKTPLSVLKINVHNVKNESKEQLPSMKGLVAGVDRMAHVVDQILTLNRTNPEQMSIKSEAVDVKALAIEVISELYPEINQRRQKISLQADGSELDKFIIMANRFSLHILMQNLISNASKYTPEKGEILVSIIRDKQDTAIDSLCFIVEDSGPGIKEEEYGRIFNRFYRVGGDQHNSSIIGCGLGLSIVKHIVQLHGAKISLAKSPLLSGFKVCICFPIIIEGVNKGNNNG